MANNSISNILSKMGNGAAPSNRVMRIAQQPKTTVQTSAQNTPNSNPLTSILSRMSGNPDTVSTIRAPQKSYQQRVAEGEAAYQKRAAQQEESDAKVRSSFWDILGNAAAMQNSQYLPVDQQLSLAQRQAKAANDFTTGLKESKEASKAIEWDGRQQMVDEYKHLSYEANRARTFHDPKASELAQQAAYLQKEIQRRDVMAGNGERDLNGADRITSVVGSSAKGIGSGLVEFGADVGQAIGKASVNQQLLSENQFLVDQMLGEDTMARYNQINAAMESEEGQRVWNQMYSVADSLGEGAARDLNRAKNGLGAIGRAGVDIGVNVLQMGFDAGVGALTGGSSLVPMFARVAGESMREARLEGASLERRLAYGVTKGTIEVATEKMFDGVAKLYGKGAMDDIVEVAIRRAATTDAGKSMLRILAGASGEAVEEVVSSLLDPLAEAVKTGKIGKLDAEEMAYSAFIGFTIGFLGGGTTMINGENAKLNAQANSLTNAYTQLGESPTVRQELSDRALASPDAYIGAHDPNANRLRTIQNALLNPVSSRVNRGTQTNNTNGTTTAVEEDSRTNLSPEERYVENVLADESMSDNEKATRILSSGYYAEAFENMSGVELDGTEVENKRAIREWLQNRAGAQEDSEGADVLPGGANASTDESGELNSDSYVGRHAASSESTAEGSDSYVGRHETRGATLESRTPVSFTTEEGRRVLDNGQTQADFIREGEQDEGAILYTQERNGRRVSNSAAYNDAIDSAIEDVQEDRRNISAIANGEDTYASLTPQERADLLNFLSTELDPESGYTEPYLPDGGEWYVSNGEVIQAENSIRGDWESDGNIASNSFVRAEDQDAEYTRVKRTPSRSEEEAAQDQSEEGRDEIQMRTQKQADVEDTKQPLATNPRSLTPEQAAREDNWRERNRQKANQQKADSDNWDRRNFNSKEEARAAEEEAKRNKKVRLLKDLKSKGYIINRYLGVPSTNFKSPDFVEVQKNPAALKAMVEGTGKWESWSARARLDMLERLFPEANWHLEHGRPGYESGSGADNGFNYSEARVLDNRIIFKRADRSGGRFTATPDTITLLKTTKPGVDQYGFSTAGNDNINGFVPVTDALADKSNINRLNRNNPLLNQTARNGRMNASNQKGANNNGTRTLETRNGEAENPSQNNSEQHADSAGARPDVSGRARRYFGEQAKVRQPKTARDFRATTIAAFSGGSKVTVGIVDAPALSSETNGVTTINDDGTVNIELRGKHPAGEIGRDCSAAHEATHAGFYVLFGQAAYDEADAALDDFIQHCESISPTLADNARKIAKFFSNRFSADIASSEFFGYLAGGDIVVSPKNAKAFNRLQQEVRTFLVDKGIARDGQYSEIPTCSEYSDAFAGKENARAPLIEKRNKLARIIAQLEQEAEWAHEYNAEERLEDVYREYNQVSAEIEALESRGTTSQSSDRVPKKAARGMARGKYEEDLFRQQELRNEKRGVTVVGREEDYRGKHQASEPQSAAEYAAMQNEAGEDGRSNVDMAKQERATTEEEYRQQRYADTRGVDSAAGWSQQERARRESQREAEETVEAAENHFAATQAYGEEVHRNIIKTANRVANMVFLPDPSGKPVRNRNARHMQPLIDAVVGLADGSLTLNDFINTYHEFGEAENKDTVGYFYDPAVDARLRRLKEFPMDDEGQYSTEARSILKETMDMLEHRTQRLLNKRADASKAVTEIKSTNTGLDGSTPALLKGFMLKQLRPDTFFHAITGFAKNTSNIAYQLAGKAEKSTQRKINVSTSAQNYFRGAMENMKAYRDFSTGKTKINTKIPGLDRSMSMNEALGLLRTLETDGAKDHIIKCAEREVDDDGYGTVFSHSEKDLYGGNQENGFRNPARASLLSDEAIKALQDAWSVDPNQRGRAIAHARAKARLELDALAKSLRAEVEADAVASKFDQAITRAMRMLGKEIDTTYSAMYGVKAAKQGKNYWPLSIASTGNNAELMSDIRSGLKNAKFIQERVGPSGSLRIMTATDVMSRYIDAASNFAAFAELSDDLELMSKTYRGDTSFKAQLEKSFGREAGQWLDRYVDTLNGKRGNASRLATLIRSNLAQSSLLLNGGVALKQSPSYFDMVGAGIDFDIAMQAWRPLRSAKSWSNNPLVNVIATRSSMLESRKQGYSDVEIGEMTKDARNLSKRLVDRIPTALTNWITKTDFRTVSNVLLACQMQVEKNGGVEVGSAEYYDRIARLFEDVVLKTQPIYTAQFRAEYQRSDNELIRSLSMFRSQQTQNLNQIINAVGEYNQIKKGGNPESIRKAEQNMHRVFAGQITGSVLFGILSGVARGLLRKDDDFKDKDGNVTAGAVLSRLGLNTAESIAGTIWFGDVAAKALVDVVSNAVTGGKGTKEFYSVNDNVISGFNSFITNLISFASKPSAKKGWNIAFSLSQLTGLPIRNCYNMVNAVVKDFQSVDERFNFTVDDSSENAPAEPDKNAASTALANAATATKPSSTSSEKKEDTDLDKQIRIAKKEASEYDTSRDNAAMDKILAAKLGDDDTDSYVDKYMSKPYREVYFTLRDAGFEPKEIYSRYKDIDSENGGNGNISQKEMLAYYKAHPEASALIAAIYNSKGYTKYPTWEEYIKHKK